MKPKTLTPQIAETLKQKFGTYTAAAEELGITYSRWRILIRQQLKLNRRLVKILDILLEDND